MFTVRATVVDGATGTSRINLRSGASVINADFNDLVLSPAPTNADTDPVDGLVTFGAATNPTVNLSVNNTNIAEAAGAATFTATLSQTSAQAVTIDLVFAGSAALTSDYTRSGAQIVIPAGSTTGTVTVTAVQDTLFEGNETVVVSLGTLTNATAGATSSATTTITDDDAAPTVNLSVNPASIAEAAGVATYTATLSAVSGLATTVNLSFAGTATQTSDYTASATQIVIPAGSTTGSITITAVQDTLFEGNETVIVSLGTLTNATAGATNSATTTINDDDAAPTVNLSVNPASIAEATGVATYTATLSLYQVLLPL